jgi:hypothetical protein
LPESAGQGAKSGEGSLGPGAGLIAPNGWATVWLGAHPCALLEDSELKVFRSRFSSHNRVSRLDMTPSVFYDGPAKIYL